MQIRCQQCHRPFSINRDSIPVILETMDAESLTHHNANCPHCGKANRVSRKELERWAPTGAQQRSEPAEPT